MKRVAILLDENGKEIYRGCPAMMPVRFVVDPGTDDSSDEMVEWTMAEVPDSGNPIDEVGDDMVIYDGDWY